jgi:membrane protein YdbS with pleckstrin-like domain
VTNSRRLLEDGERVVVSTRTHIKRMLVPAVLLILVAGVAGFLSTLPTGSARPLLQAVVAGVALLVVLRVVVRPFLRWLTTSYTVTDRRLITRSGFLGRRYWDLPLEAITDLGYERGLIDRVVGAGTLVVTDDGEYGDVRLYDVPHVELLHQELSRAVQAAEDPPTLVDHPRHPSGRDDRA